LGNIPAMGLGDWFTGKRKTAETVRRPDELITVYDERGRELRIKRRDWVASVLTPALEKAWNNPKELYVQIVQALRDDLVEQVAKAAEHLVEIDHESEGALVLVAVVRMETGDLDGADSALQRSIKGHGPSGVVLTNLAKILDRRGENAQSRATLRRALELDPNQDNGLLWWAARARDDGGEAAHTAALEEIAALPGAWRPQLWLARERLKQGDRQAALSLYDHALSGAHEAPDVLMMVTGDLGNAGALEDLVRLGAPRYKPEVHGPPAGMNLVQAMKQLGRIDEARALLRRLQMMNWTPLAASLAALDEELAAASLPKRDDSVPEIGLMTLDGPLWTRGLFEPDWLWPPADDDQPSIALSTFANETLAGSEPQIQKVDPMGRLTRALPLYLSEILGRRYRLRSRASMLVVKNQGAAVIGKQLAREALESAAPSAGARRVVVAGSLVSAGVRLQLWEIGSTEPPAVLNVDVSLKDVGAVLDGVERALTAALEERGLLSAAQVPSFYRPPRPDLLEGYVSALEQLLYQVLAANAIVRAESLWNERGFFETYFGLVEAWPNPPESTRLIAICGTIAAIQYKSAFAEPYRKIVLKWLDESAPGSVVRQLTPAVLKRLGEQERFRQWMQRAPALGDARYMAWLERVKTEA
jgi:tetratricopeptide (TPR) repeat protein